MNKILFILFIVCSRACFAQVSFEKIYTISGYGMNGSKVIQEQDGTFLILANAYSGVSINKGCLVKADSIGNILWAKYYSEQLFNHISFSNFELTPNNDYIISGTASNATSRRILMMKVDSLGNIIWSNCYGQGLNNSNAGWCVKVLSDGNYLIGGAIDSGDIYFIKTDTSGNTLWSRSISTGGFDVATGIETCSNGNFVVMGKDSSGTTLAEFDNSGNLVWNKTYSLLNGHDLTQWGVRRCPDNGFAIVGVWNADTSGFWPYLLKTDSSGNPIWCKIYTQTTRPAIVGEFFDIRITADSGFILTWEPEYPCQYCRTGLIKTDSLGYIEWAINYQLNTYTFPSSAIQTSDLGYVIIGEAISSTGRGIGFFKTDSNGETGCYDSTLAVVPINSTVTTNTYGTLGSGHFLNAFNPVATTVSITDTNSCYQLNLSEIDLESQTSELLIFPNPANQGITITTNYSHDINVEIKIIDMLGQIILSKNERTIDNGHLLATINTENISPGIYFVKLYDGERGYCRKIIIEHY